MIRPQNNGVRTAVDLSGIWTLRLDCPDSPHLDIAIPGSWNEQLAEAGLMNHTGPVWLSTDVFIPQDAGNRRVAIRFGSADYEAEVFWNDRFVGRSGSLKLPFEVDITDLAEPGRMGVLSVRVVAELPQQGPTQRVTKADYIAEGRAKDEYLPAVRFDFFPFGGLNRPVHLLLTPVQRILAVRVTTDIDGSDGLVDVEVEATAGIETIRFGPPLNCAATLDGGKARVRVRLPAARFWSPGDPHLYALDVSADTPAGTLLDRVSLSFGIRTVRVDGDRLLLNGVPIRLRGFGKHEDAPILGAGTSPAQLVKDFQLLKWCGANSVRTSHYPYDDSFYDMADRQGILVIDEVFSVNLDFRKVTRDGLESHKRAVADLIARDFNHPSVIAWSLANEPGYLGEAEYAAASRPYWEELFAHARALDPTRPLTHANVQYAGLEDPAFEMSDFLMLNRYYGWYSVPAQLDAAAALLSADLARLAQRHGKPLFVSEFGADAMAGLHATTDQLFTEEYQADLIARYWEVISSHPACIGGHVWNFADFRTAQHGRRVVMNLKGVFTRTREPKRAAFRLRELWRNGP